jgi:Ca-activated chloride channel family protein
MGKLFTFVIALTIYNLSFSQDLERKNLYYGNKAYDEKEFDDAILYYEEALKTSPLSFKTNFNMANAYFKKGDFQQATDLYSTLLDLAPTAFDRSKVYHNLGNAQFMNQKLDDAIESYKEALKINPKDEDSRYNLAYALLLKNQQQQQEQEQKQNENENENDENSDENQDGQNDQNQQEGDEKNQDKNDEQKEGDEEKDQNEKDSDGNNGDEKTDKQKAAQQNKISKEQAKRILDAALKKEKEVQKKLEKYKQVGTGESSKKDW